MKIYSIPLVFSFIISISSVSSESEGSCVGRCGQGYVRADPCHCDYNCMSYMECCQDYKKVCTTEASCKGRCHEGFIRGQTCDCDPGCSRFGKCCPDYEDNCAQPNQPVRPAPSSQDQPVRGGRDETPEPTKKPEDQEREDKPEDRIQKDEAVPEKDKKIPLDKKDRSKETPKVAQPLKKTTKRSPRRTRKKNSLSPEEDTEDPPENSPTSSLSSPKKNKKRKPGKKRYRVIHLEDDDDDEDPNEGNPPSPRHKKMSPKKKKKNPKYSTPKNPRKKKRRIIVQYEDDPEGNGKRRSLSPKDKKRKPKKAPKKPKKKKTIVESEEEIEESEENMSSSSFSSSSSSSSVRGSKTTKKLSRKNQKKSKDEDDKPDPDNPDKEAGDPNETPKDKDKKPKKPKTKDGEDPESHPEEPNSDDKDKNPKKTIETLGDPEDPDTPPKEPKQKNPDDGDKPGKPKTPEGKEGDDTDDTGKPPKEPNQRNPEDGDKPGKPKTPKGKEGDGPDGTGKPAKEPNQKDPGDGDKPGKSKTPKEKEGDDPEDTGKPPKDPNQRNPDGGDEPGKPKTPKEKGEDGPEDTGKSPKEPNPKEKKKPKKTNTLEVEENIEEETDVNNANNEDSNKFKSNQRITKRRSPAKKKPKRLEDDSDDPSENPSPSDKKKKKPNSNSPDKKKGKPTDEDVDEDISPSDKGSNKPNSNKPNKKKAKPTKEDDDEPSKPGKGKKPKKKPNSKAISKIKKKKVNSEEERQETVESEFSSSSQSSSSHTRSKSTRRLTGKNKKKLKDQKKKFPELPPEDPLMPPDPKKDKELLPTPEPTFKDGGSGDDGSGMDFLSTTIQPTTLVIHSTTTASPTTTQKNQTEGTSNPSTSSTRNPGVTSERGRISTMTILPTTEATEKTTIMMSTSPQSTTAKDKTTGKSTSPETPPQQSKNSKHTTAMNDLETSVIVTLLTTVAGNLNDVTTAPSHDDGFTVKQLESNTIDKDVTSSTNPISLMEMATTETSDVKNSIISTLNPDVRQLTDSLSTYKTTKEIKKETSPYPKNTYNAEEATTRTSITVESTENIVSEKRSTEDIKSTVEDIGTLAQTTPPVVNQPTISLIENFVTSQKIQSTEESISHTLGSSTTNIFTVALKPTDKEYFIKTTVPDEVHGTEHSKTLAETQNLTEGLHDLPPATTAATAANLHGPESNTDYETKHLLLSATTTNDESSATHSRVTTDINSESSSRTGSKDNIFTTETNANYIISTLAETKPSQDPIFETTYIKEKITTQDTLDPIDKFSTQQTTFTKADNVNEKENVSKLIEIVSSNTAPSTAHTVIPEVANLSKSTTETRAASSEQSISTTEATHFPTESELHSTAETLREKQTTKTTFTQTTLKQNIETEVSIEPVTNDIQTIGSTEVKTSSDVIATENTRQSRSEMSESSYSSQTISMTTESKPLTKGTRNPVGTLSPATNPLKMIESTVRIGSETSGITQNSFSTVPSEVSDREDVKFTTHIPKITTESQTGENTNKIPIPTSISNTDPKTEKITGTSNTEAETSSSQLHSTLLPIEISTPETPKKEAFDTVPPDVRPTGTTLITVESFPTQQPPFTEAHNINEKQNMSQIEDTILTSTTKSVMTTASMSSDTAPSTLIIAESESLRKTTAETNHFTAASSEQSISTTEVTHFPTERELRSTYDTSMQIKTEQSTGQTLGTGITGTVPSNIKTSSAMVITENTNPSWSVSEVSSLSQTVRFTTESKPYTETTRNLVGTLPTASDQMQVIESTENIGTKNLLTSDVVQNAPSNVASEVPKRGEDIMITYSTDITTETQGDISKLPHPTSISNADSTSEKISYTALVSTSTEGETSKAPLPMELSTLETPLDEGVKSTQGISTHSPNEFTSKDVTVSPDVKSTGTIIKTTDLLEGTSLTGTIQTEKSLTLTTIDVSKSVKSHEDHLTSTITPTLTKDAEVNDMTFLQVTIKGNDEKPTTLTFPIVDKGHLSTVETIEFLSVGSTHTNYISKDNVISNTPQTITLQTTDIIKQQDTDDKSTHSTLHPSNMTPIELSTTDIEIAKLTTSTSSDQELKVTMEVKDLESTTLQFPLLSNTAELHHGGSTLLPIDFKTDLATERKLINPTSYTDHITSKDPKETSSTQTVKNSTTITLIETTDNLFNLATSDRSSDVSEHHNTTGPLLEEGVNETKTEVLKETLSSVVPAYLEISSATTLVSFSHTHKTIASTNLEEQPTAIPDATLNEATNSSLSTTSDIVDLIPTSTELNRNNTVHQTMQAADEQTLDWSSVKPTVDQLKTASDHVKLKTTLAPIETNTNIVSGSSPLVKITEKIKSLAVSETQATHVSDKSLSSVTMVNEMTREAENPINPSLSITMLTSVGTNPIVLRTEIMPSSKEIMSTVTIVPSLLHTQDSEEIQDPKESSTNSLLSSSPQPKVTQTQEDYSLALSSVTMVSSMAKESKSTISAPLPIAKNEELMLTPVGTNAVSVGTEEFPLTKEQLLITTEVPLDSKETLLDKETSTHSVSISSPHLFKTSEEQKDVSVTRHKTQWPHTQSPVSPEQSGRTSFSSHVSDQTIYSVTMVNGMKSNTTSTSKPTLSKNTDEGLVLTPAGTNTVEAGTKEVPPSEEPVSTVTKISSQFLSKDSQETQDPKESPISNSVSSSSPLTITQTQDYSTIVGTETVHKTQWPQTQDQFSTELSERTTFSTHVSDLPLSSITMVSRLSRQVESTVNPTLPPATNEELILTPNGTSTVAVATRELPLSKEPVSKVTEVSTLFSKLNSPETSTWDTTTEHLHSSISTIVPKDPIDTTESAIGLTTSILDKYSSTDQSSSVIMTTDKTKSLTTPPSSELEDMTKSIPPIIPKDTPTSTSFKMIHKHYTTFLDSTAIQGLITRKFRTENEQLATETTKSTLATRENNLLSTLLNLDGGKIKTTHGISKYSPLPYYTSEIPGFKGNSTSTQGLDSNTDKNVPMSATTSSIIDANIISAKHTSTIVTGSSFMNVYEPSFNFSVSTLKTPEDQSTTGSSGITPTTVSGKVQETTNTLSFSSESVDPTKQTHPVTDNATTQKSEKALTKETINQSDITANTETTTGHSEKLQTTQSKITAMEPNAEPQQTLTTEQPVKLTTGQPEEESEVSTIMSTEKHTPTPAKSVVETTTKYTEEDDSEMSTKSVRPTKTPDHTRFPTKRPMKPEEVDHTKSTKSPISNPYHVCDLLKDEAIKVRISEDDLQHVTRICTEMQRHYLLNNPHMVMPNWNQQPGTRIIQIAEEIYRRMNRFPMINVTVVHDYTIHKPTKWLLLLNRIKSSNDPLKNLCIGQPADGMTTLQNGSMVVFRGPYFWMLHQGGVIGNPRKITEVWGIPSPIDTVFTRCNCGGKTFFFKGSRYWRFTNDVMDQGYPKEIIKGFGGLSGKITAVLPIAGFRTRPESVYFFKPGGYVQKYTFRQEQAKKCTKKKRPSIQYPIYSQKVQTVRYRFPRDIVRHRIQIHRTYTTVQQPLGVLHEQTLVSATWRGVPNNIISAISLPNHAKQDGFDYYTFTKDKYYNINMSSKVAVKPPPGAEQKTTKDWYKCKE